MGCSPPDSTVHGILQARVLEWVAMPFSRGSSWPRDWTHVSSIAGRFFTIWATVFSWLGWRSHQDVVNSRDYRPATILAVEIFSQVSGMLGSWLVTLLCLNLCDPMDCSPPASSVHGIFFQARILEWVATSSSRRSDRPRDWTQVYCIAGRFFTAESLSHWRSPWKFLNCPPKQQFPEMLSTPQK